MQSITSRLSTWHLKTAYHGLLKDVLGNIEVVRRLDRAYDILTRSTDYEVKYVSGKPVTFEIKGPNNTYTVINSQRLCTCPDGVVLCKHRLCVSLILNAIALQNKDGLAITLKDNT